MKNVFRTNTSFSDQQIRDIFNSINDISDFFVFEVIYKILIKIKHTRVIKHTNIVQLFAFLRYIIQRFNINTEDCINLLVSKNQDYTGNDPDFFSNFFTLLEYDDFDYSDYKQFVVIYTGLLSRLGDKLRRIETFLNGNKLNHEGFEDSVKDFINYCIIAYLFLQRAVEKSVIKYSDN